MVYAISDIHGNYPVWLSVKKTLLDDHPDNRIIFLGDAADRGVDGYKIMNELLDDPRVVYLKGNHEDMFVKGAYDISRCAFDEGLSVRDFLIQNYFDLRSITRFYSCENLEQSLANGSMSTFQAWIDDGASFNFVHRLAHLPLQYHYKNYDLCHAGTLKVEWEVGNDDAMLWSREHFSEEWYNELILVHGHTPVSFIPDATCENFPFQYQRNKICVDCGTAWTNTAGVINLDTEELFAIESIKGETIIMTEPYEDD